jgi:hypothetical protein
VSAEENVVVGQALQDMRSGEVGRFRLGGPDAAVFGRIEQPLVRWHPSDLDRCEHGRHSIDSCFDCPHGRSTGNLYLQTPSHYQPDVPLVWGDMDRKRVRALETGQIQVRIGTMVRGEPIWVATYDKPRGTAVTEDDGKLPCSACGYRVVPGLHTEAECIKNQQDDAAEQSQDQEQS